MTDTQYNEKTFRLLRGLRRPNPELDALLDASSQPESPVPAPKRHKLVPVYGLPVLCHCPKYGEFWRPKIIGHELVRIDDSAGDSDMRRNDKFDDVAKASPMVDEDLQIYKKIDSHRSKFEDNRSKDTSKANEDVRLYKKNDTNRNKSEDGDAQAAPITDEDVKFYKKNDAHRSSLASEDTGKLTAEKITNNLRQYEDNTYKIMRGFRKIDEELVQALPSLCAESLATRRAPRVRVVPTYGQPVLVHCARYVTFRQWKIVDHEIVRPGQQAEEEEVVQVPEDVGDGVEVDERIFPENDAAYRRYKKFDTYMYDQSDTDDDNDAGTEKVDAASTARQPSPVSEVPVPPPQIATVDDDAEDMEGLFGIYAREH